MTTETDGLPTVPAAESAVDVEETIQLFQEAMPALFEDDWRAAEFWSTIGDPLIKIAQRVADAEADLCRLKDTIATCGEHESVLKEDVDLLNTARQTDAETIKQLRTKLADAERERDRLRHDMGIAPDANIHDAVGGLMVDNNALRARVAELEKKLVGIVPSLLSPAQAANPNPSIADLRKGADIVARLKEPKTI